MALQIASSSISESSISKSSSQSSPLDASKAKNALIKITQSHNNYYVWNAFDAIRLRRDFRIVGHFVGSLPNAGLQLQASGLPLQLTKQEVTLLLELEVVYITQVVRETPCHSLTQEFTKYRDEVAKEYMELSIKEKVENILLNKDNILAGFRSRNHCDINKSDEDIIEEKLAAAKKVDCSQDKSLVQSYTSCPFKQFIQPVAEPRLSDTSDVKYHVFKDLWMRNYYLTSGSKFSCDFLVYESDPIICHSKFMVVCIDCNKCSSSFSSSLASQIRGRLSVQVNKRLVFALVQMSTDSPRDTKVVIEYQEFRWQGKNRPKVFH